MKQESDSDEFIKIPNSVNLSKRGPKNKWLSRCVQRSVSFPESLLVNLDEEVERFNIPSFSEWIVTKLLSSDSEFALEFSKRVDWERHSLSVLLEKIKSEKEKLEKSQPKNLFEKYTEAIQEDFPEIRTLINEEIRKKTEKKYLIQRVFKKITFILFNVHKRIVKNEKGMKKLILNEYQKILLENDEKKDTMLLFNNERK